MAKKNPAPLGFRFKWSRFFSLSYRFTSLFTNLFTNFLKGIVSTSLLAKASYLSAFLLLADNLHDLRAIYQTKEFKARHFWTIVSFTGIIFLTTLLLTSEIGRIFAFTAAFGFYLELTTLGSIFLLSMTSRIRGGARALENNDQRLLLKTVFRSLTTLLTITAAIVALFLPGTTLTAATISLACGFSMLVYKFAMYHYKDHSITIAAPSQEPTQQKPQEKASTSTSFLRFSLRSNALTEKPAQSPKPFSKKDPHQTP